MGSTVLLSHPQLSSCFRRLDPAKQHRYAAPRIKAAPFPSSPRRHRRILRSALEDDGREGQQQPQPQPPLGGVGATVEERPAENFQEDSPESIKQDNGQSDLYNLLYPSKELLPDDKEMSISDHLEELRQRIFLSVLAVGAAILGCFAFSKDLILLLEAPVSAQGVRFLQLSPGEFFFTTLKVSGYCGLLLGSPVILYEIIAFVLPGLTRDERSYAEGAVESLWSIDQYFEFVLVLMFSTGLSFQVPVIQLLLGQIGLVSGDQMLSIWRYVVVGAVVAAAVLTPSTDPLTQILLAGPLLGLYLGGAWMVKLVGR
ncbi:sec-independent protein translocase protein TATC, chloroplastic isoform X3 [Elaeis guineensis]|uniref:sec-independent protein translocase protein TATC, chloroplastic isoform X3 n=1 Tax=Elaeis guineensis var. tenera TaxID=51953 RepID=UPI003C6CF7E1